MNITKEIINKLFKHGEKEAPIEACGYLAGIDNRVVKFYPMKNTDRSREHFSLDPEEQFDVIEKVREEELKLLAVYHTHPESPARPSKEDIKLAYDPEILYVIISLKEKSKGIKAFKIIEGKVSEGDLIVEEQ